MMETMDADVNYWLMPLSVNCEVGWSLGNKEGCR